MQRNAAGLLFVQICAGPHGWTTVYSIYFNSYIRKSNSDISVHAHLYYPIFVRNITRIVAECCDDSWSLDAILVGHQYEQPRLYPTRDWNWQAGIFPRLNQVPANYKGCHKPIATCRQEMGNIVHIREVGHRVLWFAKLLRLILDLHIIISIISIYSMPFMTK